MNLKRLFLLYFLTTFSLNYSMEAVKNFFSAPSTSYGAFGLTAAAVVSYSIGFNIAIDRISPIKQKSENPRSNMWFALKQGLKEGCVPGLVVGTLAAGCSTLGSLPYCTNTKLLFYLTSGAIGTSVFSLYHAYQRTKKCYEAHCENEDTDKKFWEWMAREANVTSGNISFFMNAGLLSFILFERLGR